MGQSNNSETGGEQTSVRLVLDGVPLHVWSHEIRGEVQVIGRDEDCDIVIVHKRVSRRHAAVHWNGNALALKDLGSSNGTMFKSERVESVSLKVGDSFSVGQISIRVADAETLPWQSDEDANRTTHVSDADEAADPSIDFFLKQRFAEIGNLSKAQLRVLRLLLDGSSENDTASGLFLSPNTVHSHVKAIYRVFAVNSRAELMAKFIGPDFRGERSIIGSD